MYIVFSASSAGETNCWANNSLPEPISVNAIIVNPLGTPPRISLSNFGTPKEPTLPKNSSSSESNCTSLAIFSHLNVSLLDLYQPNLCNINLDLIIPEEVSGRVHSILPKEHLVA